MIFEKTGYATLSYDGFYYFCKTTAPIGNSTTIYSDFSSQSAKIGEKLHKSYSKNTLIKPQVDGLF